MQGKEKRAVIRVPLIAEKCTWKLVDAIEGFQSKLIDFSEQGAFIHSTISFPIKSQILIHFTLPNDLGIIPVYAEVRWQRWAVKKKDKAKVETGMGVKFIDIDSNTQKILASYAVYLRNKQIIAVSQRIIEEFFNKVPPNVKR